MVTVSPIMMVTSYASIILVSWFGANMIVSSELTTGELTSMLTYCMNILMNLLMVAMVFVMLTMSLASGKRVAGVLNENQRLQIPKTLFTRLRTEALSLTMFHSHTTQKPKTDSQRYQPKIKSGETIGIIGGTGSSKTSLVNLIARLYDVTEGSVKVGGKMFVTMISKLCVTRFRLCSSRMFFSAVQSLTTSDGATKMLQRKNASMPASLPVQMRLSKASPISTTQNRTGRY